MLVSHAATVLLTKDIEGSLNFYRDLLGFEITFTWQNPIDYAVLKLGGVSLHLTKATQSNASLQTAVYIFVGGIDELYKEYENKGVNFQTQSATANTGCATSISRIRKDT